MLLHNNTCIFAVFKMNLFLFPPFFFLDSTHCLKLCFSQLSSDWLFLPDVRLKQQAGRSTLVAANHIQVNCSDCSLLSFSVYYLNFQIFLIWTSFSATVNICQKTNKNISGPLQMSGNDTKSNLTCTCMCCSSAWPRLCGSQTACRIRHYCKLWATPRSGRFPGESWSLTDRQERQNISSRQHQI